MFKHVVPLSCFLIFALFNVSAQEKLDLDALFDKHQKYYDELEEEYDDVVYGDSTEDKKIEEIDKKSTKAWRSLMNNIRENGTEEMKIAFLRAEYLSEISFRLSEVEFADGLGEVLKMKAIAAKWEARLEKLDAYAESLKKAE